MKLVESFAKRLEIAMNLRGVRAVDIVEHTGVSASKISHYLKGDYEPSNCRWADISTQMKNRGKLKYRGTAQSHLLRKEYIHYKRTCK